MKRPHLDELPPQFDLVVIGGGITGAGILREAVQAGARVLLVEQDDFASGTSSRSSKLVHGGLRYLKTGQWRLTRESVQERERLLREAPGLVEPQAFLMPLWRGRRPGPASIRFGLWLYDRMAGARTSRWLDAAQAAAAQPGLRSSGLHGAMSYQDARTDDARLVIELVIAACREGATAMNYVRAADLMKSGGRCHGVVLEDRVSGHRREIAARMVINATGAWADRLGAGAPRLRPLRGSHLLFPLARLPVASAVSWFHPADGRPIFAYPWHGMALFGTTDVDHGDTPMAQPQVSTAEARYLMDGLAFAFPELKLTLSDAVSAYAGIRPVVASGKANPSAESREFALWSTPGLIGVTGGKLTTFRVTARQALRAAARQVPELQPRAGSVIFARTETPPPPAGERIGTTPHAWSELDQAMRGEMVQHLDDLLLRRTRVGLLLGAAIEPLLPRILAGCREVLGWDEARVGAELPRYRERLAIEHGVPRA